MCNVLWISTSPSSEISKPLLRKPLYVYACGIYTCAAVVRFLRLLSISQTMCNNINIRGPMYMNMYSITSEKRSNNGQYIYGYY